MKQIKIRYIIFKVFPKYEKILIVLVLGLALIDFDVVKYGQMYGYIDVYSFNFI